ncbi:MAG: DNA polymerase III subunit gamma/tau [Oscillospiraceae bacterium]|nr:DNA polymerase III subunit gamma/tau [Oscillospiraceae bacterium]
MYKALYRTWRPMSFDDVISQPHITETLQNQVRTGKTAHAYLFTGSRGTGKTTCARILAKAVNCPHAVNGNPCLQCDICKDADRGVLSDVVEIDAASKNSLEDIRDLREGTVYRPERCAYKIYIIDEVHMLSPSAWGALLKVMEEPPAYVKFILATTEMHKVPATILSRCQRFAFHRIRLEDIAARLRDIAEKEQISLAEGADLQIARCADGGMRDAISLLDQCAAVSDGAITPEAVAASAGVAGRESLFRILEGVLQNNLSAALQEVDALYQCSKDMARLCEELTEQLRNMMLLRAGNVPEELLSCLPEELPRLRQITSTVTMEQILRAISILQDCRERMQRNPGKRTELELALIRLTMPATVTVPVASRQVVQQPVSTVSTAPVQQQATPTPQTVAPTALVSSVSQEIRPVTQWADILEAYRNVNPAVSGSLAESDAYIRGNTLLIVAKNAFFLTLLKNHDNARSLGETVKQILGQEYKILAKCSAPAQTEQPPVQALLQRAKDSNLETAVE